MKEKTCTIRGDKVTEIIAKKELENPKTQDKVLHYMLYFLISLISLGTFFKYAKRKVK